MAKNFYLHFSSNEIQRSIEDKQKTLNAFLERIQDLQAEVNSLGAEQNKISRDVQQVSQLQSRANELQKEISLYQTEIKENKEKLIPFEVSHKWNINVLASNCRGMTNA